MVAYILAWVIASIASNDNVGWSTAWRYMFSEPVLSGLRLTLVLTAIAFVVGNVWGTVIALMRLSNNPVLKAIGWAYVWVFRATPELIQLIVWFNFGALYHHLSIGIPFGPSFGNANANDVINGWTAAILGLGLNLAARMAEIIRAGILGVDSGQSEAANAMGLSPVMRLRLVVLPQALRTIIPPTGNELIGLLKATSLVSVIALSDLLFTVQTIFARTFDPIPLLLVAVTWYLALTSILMVLQGLLERRFARGSNVYG